MARDSQDGSVSFLDCAREVRDETTRQNHILLDSHSLGSTYTGCIGMEVTMCPICMGRIAKHWLGPAGGMFVAVLYVGAIVALLGGTVGVMILLICGSVMLGVGLIILGISTRTVNTDTWGDVT